MSGSRYKLEDIADASISSYAEFILDELEESLGARITYASANECVVKFADARLGSLRIASTQGNKAYSYRWNVYSGTNEPFQGKYKSHWMKLDSLKAEELPARLRNYLDVILANAPEQVESKSSISLDSIGHTKQEVPLTLYNKLSEEELDKYQDDTHYMEYLQSIREGQE